MISARRHRRIVAGIIAGTALGALAFAQPSPLPPGVQEVCTIQFDKDQRFPARVQDDAVPCLERAVNVLKRFPDKKLVLVGLANPTKDIRAVQNGTMRETEDTTGEDVRFEDLAAYRSVNTKGYLVQWYSIDPSRILPTTNEWADGQYVKFFLVPGDANYNHNYLGTTKTNENPCTVRPCYTPDEESLKAQPRSRIAAPTKNGRSQ